MFPMVKLPIAHVKPNWLTEINWLLKRLCCNNIHFNYNTVANKLKKMLLISELLNQELILIFLPQISY